MFEEISNKNNRIKKALIFIKMRKICGLNINLVA